MIGDNTQSEVGTNPVKITGTLMSAPNSKTPNLQGAAQSLRAGINLLPTFCKYSQVNAEAMNADTGARYIKSRWSTQYDSAALFSSGDRVKRFHIYDHTNKSGAPAMQNGKISRVLNSLLMPPRVSSYPGMWHLSKRQY